MRRILLLCLTAVFMLASSELWAQDRTVSGKVTASEDGSPLPGVNVVLKGTTNGAVTDADGAYNLTVPSAGGTLVFTFIGLKSQEVEIGTRTSVDVGMEQDATQLSEVVVTALGIERNKNELAYSAQQVAGDQVTMNRSVNFINSLSGKVSGVDIKTSNTMGGSTNVVIRGYKSISGNNQALFVIDGIPVSNANNNTSAQRSGGTGADFGNAAADINPDNIESINVLKGAAATALYGSRAANGVIMITTKKGRKNSFDMTVNSGVTWGTMDKSTYAKYQKEYGGSYDQSFNPTPLAGGLSGAVPQVWYGDDASYGPAFDGSMVYQWDARDPFSPNYLTARPWAAAANDPTSFYETSVSSNQSVAIQAGGEKASFKFAYTRSDEKGSLPNSTLDKDLFNFSTSYDLTSKLNVTASGNYSKVKGVGRYGTGYNGKNPNQGFRQWWQTNVDLKEQKEAYFRNRQNVTWNWNAAGTAPLYADNIYFSRYENYSNDTRDHLFGYATANYKVTDWFSVLGRVGYDGTNDIQEERLAVTSAGTPNYSRFNRTYNETNYDLLLNFNKKFDNISLRGVIGSNMRRTRLESIRAATNGGLVVPRLYSLSNSAQPINPPGEEFERVGVDGLFANASVGFNDLVFVELSARQDKSTTLPVDNNAYLYYSAAGTLVFSELIDAPWLSLGKVRANFARVGNDATALSLYDVYDKPTALGSIPYFSLPNTKNNSKLAPEYTNSYELGLEADFFDGRVGFDFTWYQANSFDQVLGVTVTGATGYTGKWVNSGEIQNKGVELSLFAVPVSNDNFTWTVNFNFTRNRNEVISLYGEGASTVSNYPIAALQGGVSLNAAVGQPYGVIRGKDFVYTNGQRTVNDAGYYATTAASNIVIGNPNPDWIGGINNSLKFKGVALNFLIDMRHGGDIFSLDQWYGEATGIYPNSAGLNANGVASRMPVSEGGGILLPGVKADGSPNDVFGENLDGYGQTPFGYVADGQGGAPHKWYTYDGGYIKLREVGLTYSIPASIMENMKPFRGIDLSLIGRNLWIIDKNMEYADPEEGLSSGNANGGYQSGAYPMMKTYGFNVKLTF
jgi:TonB-linked SusC/RagA family outer membrane protein